MEVDREFDNASDAYHSVRFSAAWPKRHHSIFLDHAMDYLKRRAEAGGVFNMCTPRSDVIIDANANLTGTSSVITTDMGEFIVRLQRVFRASTAVDDSMSNFVIKCEGEECGFMVRQYISEEIWKYGKEHLKRKDELHYFMYVAKICELCSRFTPSPRKSFLVSETIASAKDLAVSYGPRLPALDKLEIFARSIIRGQY